MAIHPCEPDIQPESPAAVLAFARERRRAADRAEAELLQAAGWWADLHPVESIDDAAVLGDAHYADTGIPVAGEGAPLVGEFSIAEFAAVVGLPTEVGRDLIGETLELRHRLPRVWRLLQSGELPAWRARRVARATIPLTRQAAYFVDRHVAPVVHRIGPRQTDRLVEEAVARFMPEETERRRSAAADGRHLTVHGHQVTVAGTVQIEGELDLADGLALDAALAQGAETLKALGSTDSLDVRRSVAAGDLARRQLALDLRPADAEPTAVTRRRASRERKVVLHLHLSEAALAGPGAGTGHRTEGVGRVDQTRSPVTAEQIRLWCGAAGTVTVKPVVDLADHISVDAYEIPDRIAEQVRLRDPACVFPWCTRTATRCDTDHVVPHDLGGPTCACNLAPLCRRHHRIKTHAKRWRYTTVEPGTHLWTSPAGYQFLRDHTGTRCVSDAATRDQGSSEPPLPAEP